MPYLTIAQNVTNTALIDITINDELQVGDLYSIYTIRKSEFTAINKDPNNKYLTLCFDDFLCKELPYRYTNLCGREKFCVQATPTYDSSYAFAFRVDSVGGVAVTDNNDLYTKLLPFLV